MLKTVSTFSGEDQFLIAILLNIPLSMISGKTYERSQYRQEAFTSIANSWTESQKVIGPIIQVPFTTETKKTVWDEKLKAYKDSSIKTRKSLWLVIDELNIDSHVENDTRYKGIYKVPVYTTKLSYQGDLFKGVIKKIHDHGNVIKIHEPIFSLSVSDSRGISNVPILKIANEEKTFFPGSRLPFNSNGIHTLLDKEVLKNNLSFTFDLELRGMETSILYRGFLTVRKNH